MARHTLSPFWIRVEEINRWLIAPALVLLFLIIAYDLFFHAENELLSVIIVIADIFIIGVFVIDLIFLAIRAQNVSYFFRHYWLDILAIFPFALLFTLVSRVYRVFLLTEQLTIAQAIFHEGLEVRKGVAVLSRTSRYAKYLKIGVRSLRIITKSRLFTHFHRKDVRARKAQQGHFSDKR